MPPATPVINRRTAKGRACRSRRLAGLMGTLMFQTRKPFVGGNQTLYGEGLPLGRALGRGQLVTGSSGSQTTQWLANARKGGLLLKLER